MSVFDQLTKIIEDSPALVFDNDGYQELPKATVSANREAVDAVEKILAAEVAGFVRFQNFKPRKDGTTAVRCQVVYDQNLGFVGVSYIPLESFKHIPAATNKEA